MPNYIIATSSTSDLPRTYLDAHQIPFIPYSYSVGEQLFEDDCREETRLSVYQGMRSGDRLRTSMINAYLYADFFRSLLDSGKDVIFLDMSQKMSVSYVHRLRYSFAVPFDRYFLSSFIIISSECTGYKPQKRQKPTVHWMLAPRLGHLWPKPVSASLLRISLSAFPAAAWFARNYPADNDRAGSPSVKLLARIFL